jgi:hypothetical protein
MNGEVAGAGDGVIIGLKMVVVGFWNSVWR